MWTVTIKCKDTQNRTYTVLVKDKNRIKTIHQNRVLFVCNYSYIFKMIIFNLFIIANVKPSIDS